MNESIQKVIDKLKKAWTAWKPVQKAIAAGIVLAVIVVLVILFKGSSKPVTVPIFSSPVTEQEARDSVAFFLDEQNIKYSISESGIFSVENEQIARRARRLVIEAGILPSNVDVFDKMLDLSNWSTTDFERKAGDLQRVTNQLKNHIETIDDIESANVVVNPGKKGLYESQNEPASVSITLRFKGRSDMAGDKNRMKGLQSLILNAVSGLTEDHIIITDSQGRKLNDFDGMADFDQLSLIEKTERMKIELAAKKQAQALNLLIRNFSADRVWAEAYVEMNTSSKTSEKTVYSPIEITPQDPSKPYDTRVTRDYFPISSQTVTKEFTGTGYNPEGPAGVEGQNPPVYSDMSNVIGKSTETGVTQNNVINTEHTVEEVAPKIDRISLGATVDGIWRTITDGNGKPVFITERNIEALRQQYPDWEDSTKYRFEIGHILRVYRPVTTEQLENMVDVIGAALGATDSNNYVVTVSHVQRDRTEIFDAEDSKIIASQNARRTIMFILVGIVVILIAFIVFRMITRELERRRRLKEEEILRRQQAERDKALWDAKQNGMEVTMSVEERKRAELQENAIAMAKEHPEDVAMLIRTWMMEE